MATLNEKKSGDNKVEETSFTFYVPKPKGWVPSPKKEKKPFSKVVKTKIYEWWHGHPFLVKEEAEIICEVRFDPKYKHLNDAAIKELIRLRVKEMYKKYMKQQKCKHENWDCDTQIRVIQCQECGKQAWIKEYRNLFTK